MVEETNDVITSQENLNVDLHRRRHAINITNNPGYRVSFFAKTISFLLRFEIKRLFTFTMLSLHSVTFEENWVRFRDM
jgi:hypothetical protein